MFLSITSSKNSINGVGRRGGPSPGLVFPIILNLLCSGHMPYTNNRCGLMFALVCNVSKVNFSSGYVVSVCVCVCDLFLCVCSTCFFRDF